MGIEMSGFSNDGKQEVEKIKERRLNEDGVLAKLIKEDSGITFEEINYFYSFLDTPRREEILNDFDTYVVKMEEAGLKPKNTVLYYILSRQDTEGLNVRQVEDGGKGSLRIDTNDEELNFKNFIKYINSILN